MNILLLVLTPLLFIIIIIFKITNYVVDKLRRKLALGIKCFDQLLDIYF